MDSSDQRIRKFTARFRPSVYRRLKHAAVDANRPLNEILNDLVEREFPAPPAPVRKARRRKIAHQMEAAS
jgi:hypothetical protein